MYYLLYLCPLARVENTVIVLKFDRVRSVLYLGAQLKNKHIKRKIYTLVPRITWTLISRIDRRFFFGV